MASTTPLYLYMATNRKEGTQAATRIGCASDPMERLRIFNSKTPIPGSDRRARQAAGHWRLLLLIAIPPRSRLSGAALKESWKRCARKIHKRFEYGIESIARHHGLPFFIDVDELKSDRRIVDELPTLTNKLLRELARDDDSSDRARKLAGALVSGTLATRTDGANGQSFDRADRPRDRYRKRKKVEEDDGGTVEQKRQITKAFEPLDREEVEGMLVGALSF